MFVYIHLVTNRYMLFRCSITANVNHQNYRTYGKYGVEDTELQNFVSDSQKPDRKLLKKKKKSHSFTYDTWLGNT